MNSSDAELVELIFIVFFAFELVLESIVPIKMGIRCPLGYLICIRSRRRLKQTTFGQSWILD